MRIYFILRHFLIIAYLYFSNPCPNLNPSPNPKAYPSPSPDPSPYPSPNPYPNLILVPTLTLTLALTLNKNFFPNPSPSANPNHSPDHKANPSPNPDRYRSLALDLDLVTLTYISRSDEVSALSFTFPSSRPIGYAADTTVFSILYFHSLTHLKITRVYFYHSLFSNFTMITCSCNEYLLKTHFHTGKLGYAGIYLFFLIFGPKHRLWVLVRTVSLEPPRRGGSNV